MGRLRLSILFADMLWISIAGLLAHRFYFGFFWYDLHQQDWQSAYINGLVCCFAMWAMLSIVMKLDCFRDGWDVPNMISRLAVGGFLWLLVLLIMCLFQNDPYPRVFLGEFAWWSVAGMILLRFGFRWFLAVIGRAGASRRVVILGNGFMAREVAEKVAHHPDMLWKIVGFLYPSDSDVGNSRGDSVEGQLTAYTLDLLGLLKQWRVQELVIALPQLTAEIHKLIKSCRDTGVSVTIVPQSYELYVSKVKLRDIGGVPLLSVRDREQRLTAFFLKRFLDVVLSGAILVPTSLFLAATSVIFLAKRRNPFRVECRCGKNERLFRMYRLNVDRDDLRLKGFDRMLVYMSLTELPQLFNVLRGDMSMVGPRPNAPAHVKHFSDWQRQLMNVRPGITGLAQVHGLREQHSSEEKSKFDRQYVFNWSPFGDLTLILQTVWTLTSRMLSRDSVPRSGKKANQGFPTIALREGIDAGRT